MSLLAQYALYRCIVVELRRSQSSVSQQLHIIGFFIWQISQKRRSIELTVDEVWLEVSSIFAVVRRP